MGIILGLTAAGCWGVADFLARQSTHRIGTYRTLLWMQIVGFTLLTLYLGASGELVRRATGTAWQGWVWGFGVSLLNVASTLALYRSFELGVLSLVSPIAASYAALTVILALLSGETLSSTGGLGLGLTLVGVTLATARLGKPPPEVAAQTSSQRQGLIWAVVAAIGFGVAFWLLGFKVQPALGSLLPVWLLRVSALVSLGGYAGLKRLTLEVPPGRGWWLVVGIGVLDTLAYIAHTTGLGVGQVAVVSVISSLFSTVTVALAWLVLRERLLLNQWAGIILIFVGIMLVSR